MAATNKTALSTILVVLILLATSALFSFILFIPSIPAAAAQQASNMEIDIPPGYDKVTDDGNLLFSIRIFNLATKGRIDVTLETDVINGQGRVIITKSETVAVETQASFVRTLKIPPDMPAGTYKLQLRLIYADGTTAVSEKYFDVIPDKDLTGIYLLIGSAVLILAVLILLFSRLKKQVERLEIRAKVHQAVKRVNLEMRKGK